jgi:hypothetical protein
MIHSIRVKARIERCFLDIKKDKERMDSCFPVGNSVLIALILHFNTAGFSVPVADNQTAGKDFVTLKPRWGRVRPKRSPAIALTLIARWPQETGSCEVIKQMRLSDVSRR